MKKLLLSTLALVATIFASNAATDSFSYEQDGGELANSQSIDGVAYTTENGIVITMKKNDAGNAPAYYTAAPACARMYAGCSVTFTAPAGGKLTEVIFNLSDYTTNVAFADNDNGYTASTGKFTADPKGTHKATWTGDAETVTITLKKEKNAAGSNPQLRVCSFDITYTAGEVTKCATPKFSLADGTYYGDQEVAITCGTDGAKIMYSLDGAAEAEYTAPVAVKGVKKHTLTAKAVKEGIDNSDVATLNIEIAEPTKVGSIAEFLMSGETEDAGTVFTLDFPVTVTRVVYAPGKDGDLRYNLFVKDAGGGNLLIYNDKTALPDYENGDIIPAGITGEYADYNGLPEMKNVNVATLGAATDKGDCTPVVKELDAITIDDLNMIVYLDNVTYTETPAKAFTAGAKSINVFWQTGWIPTDEQVEVGATIDCIAAVGNFRGAIQVNPIEILDASKEPGQGAVETVDANATTITANANGIVVATANDATATIFNAAGQLVATANVAAGESTIALPAGFYVAKVANTVAKVIVK